MLTRVGEGWVVFIKVKSLFIRQCFQRKRSRPIDILIHKGIRSCVIVLLLNSDKRE